MASYIGLDFETYGATDLPKHGLDRYVNCPTFTPLIACTWSDWDGFDASYEYDFIQDPSAVEHLGDLLAGQTIIAHNASFERAVLKRMGIDLPASRFLDSAYVSRAVGAASKLEVAAPQLMDSSKESSGKGLIKLFSIPGKLQEANGSLEFDPCIIELYPTEWAEFMKYCMVDARLGYEIGDGWRHRVTYEETQWSHITEDMNQTGWFVDLDDVRQMQYIYDINTAVQLDTFRNSYDPQGELNFNSHPQLVAWCAARNVKAKSFDEENVVKMMVLITERLKKPHLSNTQQANLLQVLDLLHTKQALGGSSLKKLKTIEAMTGTDGRLRGQYLHCGAGQTYRTSGKGVQMQNLKRLPAHPADMAELYSHPAGWTSEELAVNLRQVFRAEHPDGMLIVGDFSSVESRGLAYAAGAQWKLDAYRRGMDMYKVLAAKIDGTAYDDVTKERRQFGKVGELSCGYGAGGPAVQAFASKMGTQLTEQEAQQLVADWRATNPEVLVLWDKLDHGLKLVVEDGNSTSYTELGNGLSVQFESMSTPSSLQRMHPGVSSVQMVVRQANGVLLTRYFHGCYMRSGNVGFYKPTDLLSGDPWKNHYRDPKTKEIRFFQLYGGKLAGLLTQSLCRQMFFHALEHLTGAIQGIDNVQLVGQFHDEIVMEWQPDPFVYKSGIMQQSTSLVQAEFLLHRSMTYSRLPGFPLAADIKHDHRYTK